MAITVSHLALVVEDVQQTSDFYCSWLGFKETNRLSNERLTLVYLESGSATIELLKYHNADQPKRGSGRFDHLAFTVDDVEDYAQKLKGAGIALESEVPFVAANGRKVIFVTGPNGERLELVEA